eukprot:3535787-Rhodomonas_salina.1
MSGSHEAMSRPDDTSDAAPRDFPRGGSDRVGGVAFITAACREHGRPLDDFRPRSHAQHRPTVDTCARSIPRGCAASAISRGAAVVDSGEKGRVRGAGPRVCALGWSERAPKRRTVNATCAHSP